VQIAITRGVSSAINRCELTHARRQSIDVDKARVEHRAYEQCLSDLGCVVVQLEASSELPDSVFVEDCAIVVDEVAVMTRPGARSRRRETAAAARALAAHRTLRDIVAPATLDGGDVLVVGRRVFVGESDRSNKEGAGQLDRFLGPFGYSVQAVRVSGCLHLKSAVSAVTDTALLINRRWASDDAFRAFDLIEVDPSEPGAANALQVDGRVVYPARYTRTGARLRSAGIKVLTVDLSELAKAEGAVTCCSLVFTASFPLLRSKRTAVA
jgi:dimethylargininase